MSPPPEDFEDHPNHQAYLVPGLWRGLRLLEIVGEAEKPLSLSEIGRRLGLSRSSAFRLVYTLRQMGFLRAVGDERAFELGPRVLNLGFAYLNRQDIVRIARPPLERLRDETNISSHLAVRDGRDVLYLDCLPSRSPFVSNITTGTRAAAHAAPLGWVLLGGLPRAEIESLYRGAPMPARTGRTPQSPEALALEAERAAAAGYVVSRGFAQPGGSSINAPVFDHAGSLIAAIDISGPDMGFDAARIESFYLPAVLRAAAAISADLGWKGAA